MIQGQEKVIAYTLMHFQAELFIKNTKNTQNYAYFNKSQLYLADDT